MENQITEIKSNVDDAVDEVKKLASLKRYNATHSVFGTRWDKINNLKTSQTNPGIMGARRIIRKMQRQNMTTPGVIGILLA